MNAIQTLSSPSAISNKTNNDDGFLNTLKELMAEDIVSDYEYGSTLLLSKKKDSCRNEVTIGHSQHVQEGTITRAITNSEALVNNTLQNDILRSSSKY